LLWFGKQHICFFFWRGVIEGLLVVTMHPPECIEEMG
jgi:hypothetical protein